MDELAPELAFPLWRALRALTLWMQVAPESRRSVFEAGSMRAQEQRLLATPGPGFRDPLAVIFGELAAEQPSRERLAWACLCISEWALARPAPATAIGFAEAAAGVWPDHPRYAWLAGRMAGSRGQHRRAESWFRRAAVLARESGDREAQALALHGLANVRFREGDASAAENILQRTLRLARRHRIRTREAELYHDLFVIAANRRNHALSVRSAVRALDLYRELHHPRLVLLAEDLVAYWRTLGYSLRARRVQQALRRYLRRAPAPSPADLSMSVVRGHRAGRAPGG